MDNIELRDYFAGLIMSGKVQDLYGQPHRKDISEKNGKEEWVQVSAMEATNERIITTAKMAYKIADALLKVRGK